MRTTGIEAGLTVQPTATEIEAGRVDNIKMQILALEEQITARTLREYIVAPNLVNPATGRTPLAQIVLVNNAIVALQAKL